MPRTPKVTALPTPAAPAEGDFIASAGDPSSNIYIQASGTKRAVTQMDNDVEGDDAMGQTAHGGTSAMQGSGCVVTSPVLAGSVPQRERPPTDGNELPTAKKLKDDFVRMITVDKTVNDPLDYSLLMELDEIDI